MSKAAAPTHTATASASDDKAARTPLRQSTAEYLDLAKAIRAGGGAKGAER